jgi:hypothetical protein
MQTKQGNGVPSGRRALSQRGASDSDNQKVERQ